jgi:heme O synthase-like polyprenyltransferase
VGIEAGVRRKHLQPQRWTILKYRFIVPRINETIRSTMIKNIIVPAIIVAAIIAAAFALNPSPERHRAKIRESVAERSQLAGVLGLGALTAFASTYHPLGVASYTTVNGHTTSIGMFGMVFVMEASGG